MSKQKTPEEVIKFEFDNDIDLMIKEIIRLRAEKNHQPFYPINPWPTYPMYPGDYPYPGTWC